MELFIPKKMIRRAVFKDNCANTLMSNVDIIPFLLAVSSEGDAAIVSLIRTMFNFSSGVCN